MPCPDPREHFVRRHAGSWHVLPNGLGEEGMKPRTLGGVELVNVVGGYELHLGTLGERARLIQDQPTSFHTGTQGVRHARSVARSVRCAGMALDCDVGGDLEGASEPSLAIVPGGTKAVD